ncbi:hypothetical protein BP6252_10642 [Coleophoma cylindrospora]|uniref:DUF7779 domain-containing protein n=1 Tax=Coleophoma cylindrospora TaxID=1849047 RepID=A0A3D8QTH4_9HELO|nr:hypothetical protein BP6252_10642 [Coleophoma cylindrospora]
MAFPAASFSRWEYTVGWICALPKELEAARSLLDETHDHLIDQLATDTNIYALGSMSGHKVAITCLVSYSTNNAGIAATAMLFTFPNLRFGLMVGVGGGVPSSSGAKDIRLGDVVVSEPTGRGGGVIQYDLGKYHQATGFVRGGNLNKPSRELLVANTFLKSQPSLPKEIWEKVNEVFGKLDKENDLEVPWASPGPANDRLFKPEYVHEDGAADDCRACAESELIVRAERRRPFPRIHCGNIASGSAIMKDATIRDCLAERETVICFDTAAAGLMDDFRCLVIRGVCGYADTHKNESWLPYAAAVAAIYAKKLLQQINPKPTQRMEAIKKNQHWMVSRIVNPAFTGQNSILKLLQKELCSSSVDQQKPHRQKRFIIYGIGGSGKSEVCLKFANDNREKFWGVFWINASSRTSIEHDLAVAGEVATGAKITYEGARRWFANSTEPWLLILDNADDTEIDYSRYFPTGNFGSILITSRNNRCAIYETVGAQEFERLGEDDSITLLLKSSATKKSDWLRYKEPAREIVKILAEHALAIIQAGAFIRQRLCKLTEYLQWFECRRQELLSGHFNQATSEHGSVYVTFEVSANSIKRSPREESKDALDLLEVLAYLHRESIPEEMFERAWKRSQSLSMHNLNDNGHFSGWNVEQFPNQLDPIRLRKARNVLVSFSLVAVNEDESISMHPLVHAWAKDRLGPEDQVRAWASTSSILCLSIGTLKNDPFIMGIRTHLVAAFSLRPKTCAEKYPAFAICQTLYRLTWVLIHTRDYIMAQNVASVLLTHVEHEFYPQTMNWINALRTFAICKMNLGGFSEAIELLQPVIASDFEISSHDHIDAWLTQHNLIAAYRSNGQSHSAVEVLKRGPRTQT